VETSDTAGDLAQATAEFPALSKSDQHTLASLFAHPIARNLEWSDIESLLGRLGAVEHLHNNETSIRIGGAHLLLRRPHAKDLTIEEIMALRHFLARSGAATKHMSFVRGGSDFLVTIDHHEARVYRLVLRPTDEADQIVTPFDPHHFLRHLTHKDQTRQQGERAAEDPSFYERIAQAVVAAVPQGWIVIIGHGKGHSDAAHHLADWIRLRHPEISGRVACALAADLSALTSPQLLALGRDALAAAA